MTQEELIEKLAEKEHEHWRFWMTLFLNGLEQQPDGSLVIPPDRVEVWQKLTQTFYEELQERDKKPYLNAVAELLPIIAAYKAQSPLQRQESKSVDEEIVENIQEEVKRIPSLLNSEYAEFQDKHTMMQTYLMARILEEIEGVHNGLYVLYNEKQKGG